MADKKSFIFYTSWRHLIADLAPEIRLEIYEAVSDYAETGVKPKLSPIAAAVFPFIIKSIDENNERYESTSAKRSAAGRKGMETRYTQKEAEVTNDNKTNKCYQEVTNDNKTNKCYQEVTNDNKANNGYQGVTSVTDNDNEDDNEFSNENKKETPLTGSKEKPALADFSPHAPVDNSRKDAAADAAGLSADPSNPPCPAGEETPPPGSAPPPSPKRKVFKKPTVDEIRAYCAERHNSVDAEHFYDHYEANGWKIGGKSPMKDWRAAVRTWEKNNYTNSYGRKEQQKFGNTRPGDFAGKGYTDI